MNIQALILRWAILIALKRSWLWKLDFLQYAMKLLKEDYAKELEILKVELPDAVQDSGSSF